MLFSYIRNIRENIRSTFLKDHAGQTISFLDSQLITGKDNSFFGMKEGRHIAEIYFLS